MKTILVCGSSGFIGGHLVKRLKADSDSIIVGADINLPKYPGSKPDYFYHIDLRNPRAVYELLKSFGFDFSEVYQLAADMGGAGYVFTGDNDADILSNSAAININVLSACRDLPGLQKIFYSSSACMYPEYNQMDPERPVCSEDSAYPANPDSEYGWEKLFSERLYLAYARNYGFNVKIARFHNIFGPEGAYSGGREKAPAAICRKVAEASYGASIDIWGDGTQTRSFLYVDECIEGVLRLMVSDFAGPVNIGSEEMISIRELAEKIIDISGKKLSINTVTGPVGVRGRNSDNRLIEERLNWKPSEPLQAGLVKTYAWINEKING